MNNETLLHILHERFAVPNGWYLADEYGEPGYNLNGDKTVIVFGNYWCRCDRIDGLHGYSRHHPRLWEAFETVAEFEWDDEWVIDHNHDNKAYRSTGDSYMWQPSYVITEDGELITPDDELSTWIDWALEEPTRRIIPRTITSKRELAEHGFVEYNGTYENGWHPGQTDDPEQIVDQIHKFHGDGVDILFWWTEQSQFYTRFEALIREPQREYLSSNHLSVDLQLVDVLDHLDREQPETTAELRRVFPEIDRALATITSKSLWVDYETVGVDPELTSWVIDWIEDHTDVMWDDGEPVEISRPWENDQ